MPKAEPPTAAMRSERLNQLGRGFGTFLPLIALLLCASSSAAATNARVSAPDGLNLRDGPSTDANVLTLLPFGTAVTTTGDATADGWYPVSAAGQQGYVKGTYLDFSAPPPMKGNAVVAPADGVHLRDGPSTSANILALLPQGRLVHLTGDPTADGWYPVQVTEGSGWVDGTYLAAVVQDAQPVTIRWYGHDFDGGVLACGGVYSANDPGIAATNGWPCGTRLNVCAAGKCVAVTVRDRGHMGPGAIDLSEAAFQRLAPIAVGKLNGTLQVTAGATSSQ